MQFGFIARVDSISFRDSDHISVPENELVFITAIQCTYRAGTGETRPALRSYQGMEDVMLLFFYMPLIIASAMLQPHVAQKPVKKQED